MGHISYIDINVRRFVSDLLTFEKSVDRFLAAPDGDKERSYDLDQKTRSEWQLSLEELHAKQDRIKNFIAQQSKDFLVARIDFKHDARCGEEC